MQLTSQASWSNARKLGSDLVSSGREFLPGTTIGGVLLIGSPAVREAGKGATKAVVSKAPSIAVAGAKTAVMRGAFPILRHGAPIAGGLALNRNTTRSLEAAGFENPEAAAALSNASIATRMRGDKLVGDKTRKAFTKTARSSAKAISAAAKGTASVAAAAQKGKPLKTAAGAIGTAVKTTGHSVAGTASGLATAGRGAGDLLRAGKHLAKGLITTAAVAGASGQLLETAVDTGALPHIIEKSTGLLGGESSIDRVKAEKAAETYNSTQIGSINVPLQLDPITGTLMAADAIGALADRNTKERVYAGPDGPVYEQPRHDDTVYGRGKFVADTLEEETILGEIPIVKEVAPGAAGAVTSAGFAVARGTAKGIDYGAGKVESGLRLSAGLVGQGLGLIF